LNPRSLTNTPKNVNSANALKTLKCTNAPKIVNSANALKSVNSANEMTYVGFQTSQPVDCRCRTVKIEYLQVLTRLKKYYKL